MNKQFGYLETGPKTSKSVILLAHGAGAAMDTTFMNTIALGLAEAGLRLVRFEFPYMMERRISGKRAGPGRASAQTPYYLRIIEDIGNPARLIIGGKSFGGRVASMVADEAGVAGLICLGYPFHPSGNPSKPRTEHLEALSTPALFLQGERDTLGNRLEVDEYRLSPSISIVYLEDGDHSFKPRKGSGKTLDEHMGRAIDEVARFAREVV